MKSRRLTYFLRSAVDHLDRIADHFDPMVEPEVKVPEPEIDVKDLKGSEAILARALHGKTLLPDNLPDVMKTLNKHYHGMEIEALVVSALLTQGRGFTGVVGEPTALAYCTLMVDTTVRDYLYSSPGEEDYDD